MDSRSSQIWRELALHYFPADCFGINFFRLQIFFRHSFYVQIDVLQFVSRVRPLLMDRMTHRQRNKYTCCAWAGGSFFQLCCCVSLWFWREIGFGLIYQVCTYVLRVQYSCGVVLVFWFQRQKFFGVAYVLSVQYSCAVVSVFWLWRDIVLKMRTHFYKKILLGYFL